MATAEIDRADRHDQQNRERNPHATFGKEKDSRTDRRRYCDSKNQPRRKNSRKQFSRSATELYDMKSRREERRREKRGQFEMRATEVFEAKERTEEEKRIRRRQLAKEMKRRLEIQNKTRA